jgi:polar amino acid transport system substrate-binding protein
MHSKRFIFSLFIACLCLALGPAACEWFSGPARDKTKTGTVKKKAPKSLLRSKTAEDVLKEIQERGELRVGMQVGYVPFQMPGPEGSLIGLDADTARMAARSLGVGLRIVGLSWSELIPALLEKKIDLIMSGMTITPQRNLEVVFTVPVLETGRMFLVHRKNASRFKRFGDLDEPGVFVVSAPGTLGGLRLGDLIPKAGHREFPDRAAALKEVIEERAQGYVDEEFAVRLACAKRPDVLIGRFTPLTYEPVAWAVRPGDTHWLNWLDNFIRAIRRDGRLDALKKKWLRDYYLDIGDSAR